HLAEGLAPVGGAPAKLDQQWESAPGLEQRGEGPSVQQPAAYTFSPLEEVGFPKDGQVIEEPHVKRLGPVHSAEVPRIYDGKGACRLRLGSRTQRPAPR